ncbi:TOR signaling pathway regulator [Pseudovirgaria hyperparasitica]|uniref:TOR signaling pathway regulator n=1 Tax=Pseudovirgaria hyperparasitica TaxID=470096 RepID=A0A6A6VXP1_9PEZI|nr:TOR signaling pathway regulator [Pseudovirgaria hyperparasitica]KAF2754589.1 TOR signaling pathway regulator [Pseudovirgaria hyperparasitica]
MGDRSQNLRGLFAEAQAKSRDLESTWDTNSATFQENLSITIDTYEECLEAVERVSLFSPNESLEDISSGDLQYLNIHYHLADLVQKITGGNRVSYLCRAQTSYDKFLKLLDNYDMLSKSDSKLYEQYQDSPLTFSPAPSDAAKRREAKIARFREEKELKSKLQLLRQNPTALENDDDALRKLQLTQIAFHVHQTFQSLESIGQELQILKRAPQAPTQPGQTSDDPRERNDDHNAFSERLDTDLRRPLAGLTGPILSKDGKPMRPFTLLDKRQRLQDGVFRPDHSLPTMTIDEYLEEEKRRGGMIEGGGPQSEYRPEPDEDDLDKADAETMKARQWDEFKEDNPRGSGNTLNIG